MKEFRINKAFTLAEVLITLAVIGVVASMTIPSLQNHIGESARKTQWRRAYAVVANATNKMIADNGGTFNGLVYPTCKYDEANVTEKINLYASYYNVEKTVLGGGFDCGNLDYIMKLTYKASDSEEIIKNPDGSYYPFTNYSGNAIVLTDGTFLFYPAGYSAICNDGDHHKTLGRECFDIKYGIFIDVNGAKPPNMVGKDFFQIRVFEKGISPKGTDPPTLDLETCSNDSFTNGLNCGASILINPDFEVPF